MTITSEQLYLVNSIKSYLGQSTNDNVHPALLDWNELLRLAKEQKVFIIFYNHIKNEIPENYKAAYSSEYEKRRRSNQLIVKQIERLSEITRNSNVHFLILKGIVLSHWLYGDVYQRSAGDIDILLSERDISKIDAMLRKEGYFPICGKDQVYKIDISNPQLLPMPVLKDYLHHEYYPYIKNFEEKPVWIELQRYIHSTIHDEHINEFLMAYQTIKIQNIKVKTLDVEHTFLYLCENIIKEVDAFHGDATLKEYVDLYQWMKQYNQTVDWENIQKYSTKYGMNKIVNTALRYLNEIFNDCVQEGLINMFDSGGSKEIKTIIDRLFISADANNSLIERSLKLKFMESKTLEINELTNSNLSDATNFYDLIDYRYGFSNKYLPSYDKEYLYFYLNLDPNMYRIFENFKIIIDFFDMDINSEVFLHSTVEFNASQLSEQNKQENDVLSKVEIKIPLKDLPIKTNEHIRLAYNIYIKEKIYRNAEYNISSQWYIDAHFWNNPTVISF